MLQNYAISAGTANFVREIENSQNSNMQDWHIDYVVKISHQKHKSKTMWNHLYDTDAPKIV